MSRKRSSRRQFLKTTGSAASLALVSGPLLELLGGSLESLYAAPQYVRPNVKNLNANSKVIQSYKAGITAMQNLPTSSPLHWNNWANIHGAPSGSGPLWNTCQHGQWWFFPWHRMYVYWFEQIIRTLSKDASFALPYWDYSDPTQRSLPSMFLTPTTNNVLYVQQRNPGVNAGNALPASAVTYTNAFTYTNFTSPTGSSANFGSQMVNAPSHGTSPHGQLESTPHDSVHVSIGGWMGQVALAARDPIFWLHHANIDRLWNLWLTQGGGRSDPTSYALWCNQSFSFFNAGGVQVSQQVNAVLNASAQLNYSYEGEPPQVPQACKPTVRATNVDKLEVARVTLLDMHAANTLADKPVHVRIAAAQQKARLLTVAKDPKRRVSLRIEGIEVSSPVGVLYEVYVGLPANGAADFRSPHYVGNLAPFGAEMAHGEGFVAQFPIDAAVERALSAGDTLDVMFVPRGLVDRGGRDLPPAPTGRVTFKEVRIIEE